MSALELEVLGTGGARTPLPESGALVLGSSPQRAGLVLESPGVDEAHAAVGRLKDGGFALRDLGSRQGTLLNGQRVASARLAHGDVISLGSARVRAIDPACAEELARAAVSGPASVSGPGGAASATGAAPLPLPERLGGFRIQKRLGRGGMGDVYLAVQESLHRPVALKVLAPRLDADAEFVRRFEIEARAAAALNHPNVVVVHDVGIAEGHHYLAMEYMDGGNLEDRVARGGPLPWREAVDVLHDAASGLVYAEERGIVHRDIKPANLMQNAAGATKIADLGLATAIEDGGPDGSDGGTGRVFGTPHFISPEQARGEKSDHRSDLYSLGATMHRLLSGRTPFEGATTRDILRAHFQERPAPLSAGNAAIPAELSALVSRLLAKDPAHRPQSAAEVVAAARRLRASAEHGAPRARASERRPLVAALVLAAAVAAVLSGLYVGGVLGGKRGPRPDRPDAADPLAGAGGGGTPELPEVGDGSSSPATDEALRLAELAAELDRREIELRRLSPPALRDALHELAARHAGTAIAERARFDADRIDAELAADAESRAAREALLAGARAGLASLPELSLVPPQPALALAALAAAGGPADLDAAELDYLRAELAAAEVARANQFARGALEAADEAARAGDFARVEELLAGLAPVLAPVPDGVPLSPAELSELRELGEEVALRLAGLGAERAAFAASAAVEERGLVAAALSGPDGLEVHLRALDLPAARARAESLAASLATPAFAERAADFAADLARAEAALGALIAEFAAPGWRRRALTDPRRGGAIAEVAGIDAAGLTLEGGERIRFSDLMLEPEALLHLFRGRLGREWTEAEARGISALLEVAGALRAADEVAEVLNGTPGARFRASEAAAVVGAFRPLEDWAAERGTAGEVERDARACRELSLACLAASEGRHSEAVARLEHLLDDYGDCLLVLLLSDGGGATHPPPGVTTPVHGGASSGDSPTDGEASGRGADADRGEDPDEPREELPAPPRSGGSGH